MRIPKCKKSAFQSAFRPSFFITVGMAVIFLLLTDSLCQADTWWNTDWQRRVKITFDNSDQSENLTNFPVPVTLNNINLPYLDLSATAGADVRFRDATTNNEIKYEVEAWDASSDTAIVWVSVPQINGSSDTDYIWVYYDYDGTATYDQSAADEQAVWNSSYLGVWHLDEDQTGTGNTHLYKDSTDNINHGDDQVSSTGKDGKIGAGQQFDGSNDDYISLENENIADHDYDALTIEAWYKSTDWDVGPPAGIDDETIFYHSTSSETDYVRFGPTDDTPSQENHEGELRLRVKDNDTSDYAYSTDKNVVDEQWHHLAVVRTGGGTSKLKVYVDGAIITDQDDGTGGGTISLAATDDGPFIGAFPDTTPTDQVHGFVDELRVSSAARSADWIEASWRSQNGTFAFCNFVGTMECNAGDGKFSYRRTLVIDYTKVGTDNSGTLPATGFPVLVSLSGNWLKTTAVDAVNGRIENANGWDIVFRSSDGKTSLYHEIEEYDGTNGTYEAWVRIDSLSKAADTTFYMYYGNDCVNVDPSDPDNVWDSNFKGVWHLADSVTDEQISGTHDDSTDLNDGSQNLNGPIAGQIADGQDFDGSDDYVSVGNAGSGIKTVSFWLEADDDTSRKVIDLDGSDQIEINGSSNIVATSFPAATVYVDGSTASSAVTTSWHHVAITDSTGVNASDLEIGAVILLSDDFNRDDSTTVGNGWSEYEPSAGNEAQIKYNRLLLDCENTVNEPVVSHTFAKQTSGKLVWSFLFFFTRVATENDYEVWMQLGDSASLDAPPISNGRTGVAVNLKWGGPNAGLSAHETLSYYNGASLNAGGVGVVSGDGGYNNGGAARVTVTADLDANTFDISVTGDGLISGTGTATGIAFNNNVDIDTVRIYAEEVSDDDIVGKMIDDLVISGSAHMDGSIDEVRISDSVRDADWIKTEYTNQDDATPGAGNFIKSLGTESTAFGTVIDLLSLSAAGADGAVHVEWETGSETGNLGFYLYRSTSPAGPFVRITDQLIAGLNHSVEGRTYSYADTDVTDGQPYYYRLEDLDVDGQRTFHSPVGVDWGGAGAPLVSAGDPDPAPWEPGGEFGPVTVSDTDEPVYKIMVGSEGIHRLTRDFLSGQGVALDKVDLSRVRLYHEAREVAIWVHDDNGDTVFDAADHITFYALPVADEFAKYSADNVYWLTTGAGSNPVKRMAAVDSTPDASALAAGFEATVRSEQDQYYYPASPGADELDRWLNSTWVVGAGISWPGAGDPITFTIDTPGPSAAAP